MGSAIQRVALFIIEFLHCFFDLICSNHLHFGPGTWPQTMSAPNVTFNMGGSSDGGGDSESRRLGWPFIMLFYIKPSTEPSPKRHSKAQLNVPRQMTETKKKQQQQWLTIRPTVQCSPFNLCCCACDLMTLFTRQW